MSVADAIMKSVTEGPSHTASEEQQHEADAAPDGDKGSGKGATEHLALWLTLLAVGFVALRILIVARGDSDTTRALVQNLNVTAIVLATIAPLVTTTLWLAVVVLFLLAPTNKRKSNGETATQKSNTAGIRFLIVIFLGIPILAICWYAMPIKYGIFAGILSLILIAAYWGSWRGQQFRPLFQITGVLFFFIVPIAGLCIVIAQVGVWFPREILTIGSERTGTVYVLSSDERWTKYLENATHKVRIVATKDVRNRETITSDDTWNNQTLSEIVQ